MSTLLAAGIVPQTVIVPDTLPGRSITPLDPLNLHSLPMHDPAGTPDLMQIAGQHHIPVFAVSNLNHPETVDKLTTHRPEIAIVACFDRRIPPEILAIPRHGFLNMHPSLLPAYRGPAPLFWLFRDAATAHMGVTIHQMDAGMDTGDIVAQKPLTFPDGISGREADRQAAQAGATLIAEMWPTLPRGNFTTRKQPAGGSYQPWPTPADFALDIDWPARRAFNFMRATTEWQQPYPVDIDGRTFLCRWALAYSAETPHQSLQPAGDTVWLRFRPGALQVTLA